PLPPMIPMRTDMLSSGYSVPATRSEHSLDRSFAVCFSKHTRCHRRIVLEKYEVIAFDGLADKYTLERQRIHRVEVVAHDPWIGNVNRRRVHIRREYGGLSVRLNHDHLMVLRVTA